MPLTPDHDPAEDSAEPRVDAAVSALRALILASQEFRQAVANRVGVGVTDTVALSYLATDGPLGARELAERMGIASSSVTTVIDRLEAAGLARREQQPSDRRAITVVLTQAGSETVAWTRRWMQDAVHDLGEERWEVAAQVLESLASSLRGQIDALAAPGVAAPEIPNRRR